ncbi:MAG: TrmJ/YjtD family RNA methyltransferase [Nanoarchaeota archaeon]|nr:TrmJ/YjtD family RNA methyltransferase [Thermodesulfovibrionia bacterium]MCK5282335.1 TrmJ/YjtD family RNA methyltransferase [Nanoarchaeota archaeon]
MISVVLIEPKWASNVGAVARVMANFDFSELILVDPKCKTDELDAVKRAKHALSILKKAKIKKWKDLGKFDYLIATTSKLGSDYNIPRLPISPEQLSSKLSKINLKNKKIGLVFGREGEGLHNDEIRKCDMIVSVPTSVKYAAMNLSHSVAVVLYEIFKASKNKKIGEGISLVGKKEKDNLINLINKTIGGLEFSTKEKKETQKTLWKRLVGKSFLTKREAFALFGFFRKIK